MNQKLAARLSHPIGFTQPGVCAFKPYNLYGRAFLPLLFFWHAKGCGHCKFKVNSGRCFAKNPIRLFSTRHTSVYLLNHFQLSRKNVAVTINFVL